MRIISVSPTYLTTHNEDDFLSNQIYISSHLEQFTQWKQVLLVWVYFFGAKQLILWHRLLGTVGYVGSFRYRFNMNVLFFYVIDKCMYKERSFIYPICICLTKIFYYLISCNTIAMYLFPCYCFWLLRRGVCLHVRNNWFSLIFSLLIFLTE